MNKDRFGTSPVGSPATRRRPTIARADLTKTMLEFFELEPTTHEYEMIDMLLSCFMWSYSGYELVRDAALAAHKLVHREEATWTKKEMKT